MTASGGLLRKATIGLCTINLVVALYLASIVFGPLFYGISDSITVGSTEGLDPELLAEQERSRQEGLAARTNAESADLIHRVGEIRGERTRGASTSGAELEGIPQTCGAELHVDYDGFAVAWGISHLKDSPADCCRACQQHAANAKEGERRCNIWVYCPLEQGCFSPDIYEHKHKECWLKQSAKPDLNFKGAYSEAFRQEHKTAPEKVQWIGGVVSSS